MNSLLCRVGYPTLSLMLLAISGCNAGDKSELQEHKIAVTPRVIRVNELKVPDPSHPNMMIKASYTPGAGITLPGTGLATNFYRATNGVAYGSFREPIKSSTPQAAITGTTAIPYPLYPNSQQYRIGGEEGLKIVLFETEDPFYKVDAFYRNYIENEGLSRLLAMSDYVRYAAGIDDFDPWATNQPGIVIHEFPDADEALRLGANTTAKTNIIMSF